MSRITEETAWKPSPPSDGNQNETIRNRPETAEKPVGNLCNRHPWKPRNRVSIDTGFMVSGFRKKTQERRAARPTPKTEAGFVSLVVAVLAATNWGFQERAAIAEFDGGLGRHEAEQLALRELITEWNILSAPDQARAMTSAEALLHQVIDG